MNKMLAANPLDNSDLIELSHHILTVAKQYGASMADVGASVSDGYSTTVRLGEVDTVEYNRDKGFSLTVYFDKRKGSASSSDISEESIEKTVAAACNIAKYTHEDACNGLADPELMAYEYPQLDLYFPWDLPVDKAITLAKECEAKAMALDKRIENAEGTTVATARTYRVYANSHGFTGAYATSSHSIACGLVARDQQQMEADSGYTWARDPLLLHSIQEVATEAALRVTRRLNARKIKTCEVPVIFEAPIACGILRSFLSAISGGNLYRQASFMLNQLGKVAFPSWVTIEEKPFIAKGLASSPFDAEGVKLHDRFIVKNGIIESYILGSYSARKLGLQTTGNAGGTHNIFIRTHNKTLGQLIKEMDRGVLVTDVMGQGVNIVTGDYSQGATGFWIEHGEIQYPINEFTIAGKLPEMYQQIIAISNDIYPNSSLATGSILIEKMMVAGE
ncbi:MAG: metalloprotease PmbA [Legionellales bacterium]|nr:metalloprotease PmbA [Legionellales bacterium]